MSEPRWRFQVALNAALRAFLHGSDLTRLGRMLFPLRAPVRGAPLRSLRAAAEPLGVRLPPDVPEALAEGFRALGRLEPPPGPMRTVAPRAWDDAGHGRVRALGRARTRLVEAGGPAGAQFLLHGSFASLDHTGYSDLDTLAILPEAVVTDARALRHCRRVFVGTWRTLKEFDPLQHHGHFVLTEIDLRGYPDVLFPAAVLGEVVALGSRPVPLRARPVPVPALAREVFERFARRYLETDLRRGLRDAYRLKSDLSVFMLLPALWMQARGRAVDKKGSFEPTYECLQGPAVAAFRRAAEIRAAWRYEEPRAGRWLRRAYFNAILPATADAVLSRPPPPNLFPLLEPRFFDHTKDAVRALLHLHGSHEEIPALGDQVA